MSYHEPAGLHSPPEDVNQRPRGILKNSNPQTSPGLGQHSPTDSSAPVLESDPSSQRQSRPSLPREVSDKELTLANTLANAGPRRNSSNARSSVSGSRRQSAAAMELDENSPRLKWDEANIYLNEQERGDTMKIDEPKTPFAKQYDPTEDDDEEGDETPGINAHDVLVDELDKAKSPGLGQRVRKGSIPDLDLGEPEAAAVRTDSAEKKVIVDDRATDGVDGTNHSDAVSNSEEAEVKHKEFEQRRKKHYEMKDVKGLLAHPEGIDDDEDEIPPLPR